MTQHRGRAVKTRTLVLTAILTVVVGISAGAAVASEPFATQHPSIEQQGTKMMAGNGGWGSESGAVVKFVFRFSRDGITLKGPEAVPKTTNYPAVPANTWPDVSDANVYQLQAGDYGHLICVEVWGGTRSTYTYSWGELAYDVWEWGNASKDGSIARACREAISPAVAPASSSLPTISGTPMVEETLSVANGEWTGTAPLAFSVKWQHCDAAGANCTDTGVTSQSYTLPRSAIGKRIRAEVTASNAGGSRTAVSEPTAVVSDLMPTATRTWIPAEKVTAPHRLVINSATVRPARLARPGPVTFNVRVFDSRGFRIKDAEVRVAPFSGTTFLPSELVETAQNGTARLILTPAETLTLQGRRGITFVITARRPGDRWVSPRSAKALRVVVPVAQTARR